MDKDSFVHVMWDIVQLPNAINEARISEKLKEATDDACQHY